MKVILQARGTVDNLRRRFGKCEVVKVRKTGDYGSDPFSFERKLF